MGGASSDPAGWVRRETPGGGESHEGIGSGRWLNPTGCEDGFPCGARPRGRGDRLWRWRATSSSGRSTTTRGQGCRRDSTTAREGKPLKGEPWTWQRGETNPQGQARTKPSRTCETSWTELRGLGASWMLRKAEVAKRDETPREAPGKRRPGRRDREALWRGATEVEWMNRFV